LHKTESLMFLTGIVLLGVFLVVRLHSLLYSRIALWEFNTNQASQAQGNSAGVDRFLTGNPVDVSLWGKTRIRAYQASLALKIDPPIAVLNIPRLRLIAPVFDGTEDITLNRGLGRIEGTNAPGGDGNLGIAGHRDGFFRGLKDIELGDVIEIEIPGEKDVYSVDATKIVEPNDVNVLGRSQTAMVTLITCYPFYFVGNAPHRFVVKASLRNRYLLQQARVMPETQ
jgi:sortase A